MPSEPHSEGAGAPRRRPVTRRDALVAALGVGAGLTASHVIDSPRAPTNPKRTAATRPGEALDVTRVGARGDGLTDDSNALRVALSRSKFVHVPAGTFRVSLGSDGAALELSRPGTLLTFAPGAELVLAPTDRSISAILRISAADCTVRGGTLVGDLASTDTRTGEWGHGILVVRGADRTLLDGVTIRSCWGDGIYVGGGPTDVVVLNCVSDGNRRQGLSLVSAVRPLVLGGRYVNTGRVRGTAPSAGIDIEPNPGVGDAVVGAVLRNVELAGNRGDGLGMSGVWGPAQATVIAMTSIGNGGAGVEVTGAQTVLRATNCHMSRNGAGVRVDQSVSGTVLTGSQADFNASLGFDIDGPQTQILDSTATGNGSSGIRLAATATGTTVRSCQVRRSTGMSVAGPEVDVGAPASALSSLTISSEGTAPPAASGLVFRPTALGATVLDCTPTGFPRGRAIIDQRVS